MTATVCTIPPISTTSTLRFKAKAFRKDLDVLALRLSAVSEKTSMSRASRKPVD